MKSLIEQFYEQFIFLGEKCSTMIGLPDNERDELRITLATGCKDSPAVVRSILLHAAGVIPVSKTIKIYD